MADNKQNIEQLFSSSFDGFTVEPTAGAWQKLNQKLVWYRFLSFGFARFNIYYAAASVAALVCLFLCFLKNPEIVNHQTVVQLTNLSSTPKPADNNLTATNTTTKQQTQTNIPEEKADKNEISNIVQNQQTNSKIWKPRQVINAENINHNRNKQKSNVGDKIHITEFNDTATLDQDINLALNDSAFGVAQSKNLIVYDTIYVYDTIPYYDTIRTFINDWVNQSSKWSLSGYFSPLYSGNQLSTANSSYLSNIELRNTAESPLLSYSASVNISRSIGRSYVQTGLAYTRLGEQFNFFTEQALIDSSQFYRYAESQYLQMDTVDSYYIVNGNDTSIHHVVMRKWASRIDSSLVTRYDTTVLKSDFNSANTYTYIEVPILFGYRFPKNRISYTASGGIITGFYSGSKAKTIAIDNNSKVIAADEMLPFSKVTFSFVISAGVEYHLNPTISLSAEPYLRQSIYSIFKSSYPISQKYTAYGIRVGLKYYF